MLRLLALMVLLASLALAGPAPTIISVTGAGGFADGGGVYYASWTQTSTFSNVSVFASLYTIAGSASGTAYITTKVGSGATVAQQVATAPFTVTSSSPGLIQVLNGLTLGPGTYYLVLDLSANGLLWQSNALGSVTAAAGVTANSDSNAAPLVAYPPSSAQLTPSGLIDRTYLVAGNLVVPPSVPALSPVAILFTILLLSCAGGILLSAKVSRNQAGA